VRLQTELDLPTAGQGGSGSQEGLEYQPMLRKEMNLEGETSVQAGLRELHSPNLDVYNTARFSLELSGSAEKILCSRTLTPVL
jgi:hypothetical protein